jgi:hypothetical protein
VPRTTSICSTITSRWRTSRTSEGARLDQTGLQNGFHREAERAMKAGLANASAVTSPFSIRSSKKAK